MSAFVSCKSTMADLVSPPQTLQPTASKRHLFLCLHPPKEQIFEKLAGQIRGEALDRLRHSIGNERWWKDLVIRT